MSVQASGNFLNIPFVLDGCPYTDHDAVIAQDAARATPLVKFTLMAKVAASQKWTPFISEIALDGTAIPQGIYTGDDIDAATLVAGDVTDLPILVGGALIDSGQLVIEAAKTLDTVITDGARDLRSVRDHLATRGIFTKETVAASEFAV